MKQINRIPSPTANQASSPNSGTTGRQSYLRYRRSSAVNYNNPSGKAPHVDYLPPPQQKAQQYNRNKTGNQHQQQQQHHHHHHHQPSFEKEFGPFGAATERAASRKEPVNNNNNSNSNNSGDISSMFRRPPLPPQTQPQIEYPIEATTRHRMSGGFRVEEVEVDQPETCTWIKDDRSQLPSTNAPIVSTARRRNEDLDKILAKYGKNSQAEEIQQSEQQQHEGSAHLIRTNTFMLACEKYNNNNSSSGSASPQPGIHGGYWDHNPVEVVGGGPRRLVNNRALLQAQKSADHLNGNDEKTIMLKHDGGEPLVLRRSTHVFPFKETQCGMLVVDPLQIAFESRKISVLLADPNNNNGPTEYGSKHERILNEVKKAMSIAENNLNNSDSSKGKLQSSDKEVITKKYSESKKASEEFERVLLQRMVCAKNPDTHVVIGDKVFPCHGIALEIFSSYFDRLGREKEAIQRVQLNESEVTPQAFQVILNWTFQSEEARKTLVTKENLVQVYTSAKHLGVRDLELQCIGFVERKIDHTDPDLLNIWNGVKVKQSSCPELVRIIGSKLAASYRDIYQSKRYLQMDADELFMLLGSDEIAIESEMDVYNSAVTWLLHDWKTRKIHTNKLMSTVRFGLLSPLQLTQINLCPEINKFKCEKDYNQVLAYGTVKSMIDDGLSFSILAESYKDQPEELQRWVEKTGVKSPKNRTCLTNRKLNPYIMEKISLLEDASQTKLRGFRPTGPGGSEHQNLSVARSSSYTIVPAQDGGTTAVVQEISKPKLLNNNSSGVLVDRDEKKADT